MAIITPPVCGDLELAPPQMLPPLALNAMQWGEVRQGQDKLAAAASVTSRAPAP